MPTQLSALYLDFDNFFGGLVAADPALAMTFVERPAVWLDRLRNTYAGDLERRWLITRCYMNPSGWVPHPLHEGERLYFSQFRPYFTQAGFEVVDCPSLTRSGKNAADIRIVIDVMMALRADTRYEEFVLASSDADFTPLLQVLRASDRRTTVIATGSSAVAYQAVADRHLDAQDIGELLTPEEQATATEALVAVEEGAIEPAPDAVAASTGPPVAAPSPAWDSFIALVREAYGAATAPLNLARLSSTLLGKLGPEASASHWFGTGSFVRALQQAELPGAQFSQHFVWDAGRHEPPVAGERRPDVPAEVAKFFQASRLPAIPSDGWPVVFRALEAYAAMHEFNLTESTKWARDHAAAQGHEVPRTAFTYVVLASRGEAPLNAQPPPEAAAIARAVLRSAVQRARLAGFEVTADEEAALASWLQVPGDDEREDADEPQGADALEGLS